MKRKQVLCHPNGCPVFSVVDPLTGRRIVTQGELDLAGIPRQDAWDRDYIVLQDRPSTSPIPSQMPSQISRNTLTRAEIDEIQTGQTDVAKYAQAMLFSATGDTTIDEIRARIAKIFDATRDQEEKARIQAMSDLFAGLEVSDPGSFRVEFEDYALLLKWAQYGVNHSA